MLAQGGVFLAGPGSGRDEDPTRGNYSTNINQIIGHKWLRSERMNAAFLVIIWNNILPEKQIMRLTDEPDNRRFMPEGREIWHDGRLFCSLRKPSRETTKLSKTVSFLPCWVWHHKSRAVGTSCTATITLLRHTFSEDSRQRATGPAQSHSVPLSGQTEEIYGV